MKGFFVITVDRIIFLRDFLSTKQIIELIELILERRVAGSSVEQILDLCQLVMEGSICTIISVSCCSLSWKARFLALILARALRFNLASILEKSGKYVMANADERRTSAGVIESS